MRECKISLRSKINGVSNEMFVIGTLSEENGGVCIAFENAEDFSLSTTKIVLCGNQVNIFKTGEVEIFMSFEEGVPSEAFLRTPLGEIPLSVIPKRVVVEKDNEVITLGIVYEAGQGGKTDVFDINLRCEVI